MSYGSDSTTQTSKNDHDQHIWVDCLQAKPLLPVDPVDMDPANTDCLLLSGGHQVLGLQTPFDSNSDGFCQQDIICLLHAPKHSCRHYDNMQAKLILKFNYLLFWTFFAWITADVFRVYIEDCGTNLASALGWTSFVLTNIAGFNLSATVLIQVIIVKKPMLISGMLFSTLISIYFQSAANQVPAGNFNVGKFRARFGNASWAYLLNTQRNGSKSVWSCWFFLGSQPLQ